MDKCIQEALPAVEKKLLSLQLKIHDASLNYGKKEVERLAKKSSLTAQEDKYLQQLHKDIDHIKELKKKLKITSSKEHKELRVKAVEYIKRNMCLGSK